MHQELLMHVAAAHVEDRHRFAAQQRLAREAKSATKAARRSPRRLRWAIFSRPQAQSVSPSH